MILINLAKKVSILSAMIVLGSCTCATPLVVSEIQKTDKKLTCKDVILEINEAENYKELAKKEKGIGFGNALMPVCWVSSYVDVGKAVDAANARVAYLGKIYDVLDCGGKSDRSGAVNPRGMVPPPFINVQPSKADKYAPPYSPPKKNYQPRNYQPLQPQYQPPRNNNQYAPNNGGYEDDEYRRPERPSKQQYNSPQNQYPRDDSDDQ